MSWGDDMIYERIKGLREDKDWTQKFLAEKLFISRSTYSAYENGANAPPIEILVRLSVIYGTSIDYLIGVTDVKESYPKNGHQLKKSKLKSS